MRAPALPDDQECPRPEALCARAEFLVGRMKRGVCRKKRTVTSVGASVKPKPFNNRYEYGKDG